MPDEDFNERSQLLLKSLIERYIREGHPVGSQNLLEEAGLPISSATVRNVMADLEERGFICSPHTSAGRVPTAQGYRLFVDQLITMQSIDERYLQQQGMAFDPDLSAVEMANVASQLLSSMTSQAGLVTVPKSEKLSLRQVEFLPLSGNRVLVILVIDEREVQNRVLHTSRPYSEQELQQASQLINQRYSGKSLSEVRSGLLMAMQEDKDTIDTYMQTILDLASQAFEAEEEDENTDYVLSGESKLVNLSSAEDLDRLQGLFTAFDQKKDILELVDRSINAEGIQIFIGEEAGYEVFDGFSLITAPYQSDGVTLGVLGVIGPTRMSYEKVIPMVDVTAQMLTSALNKN